MDSFLLSYLKDALIKSYLMGIVFIKTASLVSMIDIVHISKKLSLFLLKLFYNEIKKSLS